jgi:SAM-dependent methyltransferase
MVSKPTLDLFDTYYYATGCGRPYQRNEEWLTFFGSIADNIIDGLQPGTVLDAGCALGFLVESLRKRGVQAFGIDISDFAIQNVHPDFKSFCWKGSIVQPFPQKYDLIVSIEVLEHMQTEEAKIAVKNLCRFTDQILFSSTPFDYKETTHFNVQPPEYWAEQFAQQGFFRDVDFDASFITPWAICFQRKNDILPRIVRNYERKFFFLWKENYDLRSLNLEFRNALASKNADNEATVNYLSGQLQEIQQSRSWRTIQKLVRLREKIVPYGSFRERLLQKLHILSKKE